MAFLPETAAGQRLAEADCSAFELLIGGRKMPQSRKPHARAWAEGRRPARIQRGLPDRGPGGSAADPGGDEQPGDPRRSPCLGDGEPNLPDRLQPQKHTAGDALAPRVRTVGTCPTCQRWKEEGPDDARVVGPPCRDLRVYRSWASRLISRRRDSHWTRSARTTSGAHPERRR